MEVRWSTLAADDLERIFERIAKDNPTAARKTVKAIYDGCRELMSFPRRGRPGRMNGRRELVFLPISLSIRSRSTPWRFLASITGRRTGLEILLILPLRWGMTESEMGQRIEVPSILRLRSGQASRGRLSPHQESLLPNLFRPLLFEQGNLALIVRRTASWTAGGADDRQHC